MKKMVLVGKLDKKYECNDFYDFHYETPLEEKDFLKTVKCIQNYSINQSNKKSNNFYELN